MGNEDSNIKGEETVSASQVGSENSSIESVEERASHSVSTLPEDEIREPISQEGASAVSTAGEETSSHGFFSSLGKFNIFLLITSILLLPLIGIMAWDTLKSQGDPVKEKNTAACELLHGKLVERSFSTEKKGSKTESFTLCEENDSGKILMATGSAYQGKDKWTDSCAGNKVFFRDTKADGSIKRSLICLNDGKVTKATTIDIN